jgi:uncharacterized protein YndB with AHSA1/START domain
MSTISVSRDIAAPPGRVFAMVADLTRMGEWSPENTGGRWVRPATGPAVGAKFRGTNRRGMRRWSTLAVITEYDPDRRVAFEVTAVGFKAGRWAYDVEPTGGGCRVTETWTDRRGPLVRIGGGLVSGVHDRDTYNRAGMEATLAGLAAAAEAGAGAGAGQPPDPG